MTAETESSTSGTDQPTDLVFAAVISPADAPAECDRAKAAMVAAEGAGTPLSVDLDGDMPNPCTLQLLIATVRSGRNKGVEVTLSERASAILSDIQIH